jgi:uncharacterized protein GlcG (DUF336 family)
MTRHLRMATVALGVCVLSAWTQPPATPPPAAAAKPIPLSLALTAAQTALDFCKANNSIAVVEVMDTAFNPKVILAGDGARAMFVEYARRKAYTVLKTGMSSGDFGKSVGPQGRGAPPINGDANLITVAGAFPISMGGSVVGALSVSGATGADIDAASAQAGLDKIKDQLK